MNWVLHSAIVCAVNGAGDVMTAQLDTDVFFGSPE
jgi:hypothetical protein